MISCPVCDWVRPLPPNVQMTSCPCGWRELEAPVQLILIETFVEIVVVAA